MTDGGKTRTPQETEWWVFHNGTMGSTLSVDEFVEKEKKKMEEKEKKWREKLSSNVDKYQRIGEDTIESRKKLLRTMIF